MCYCIKHIASYFSSTLIKIEFGRPNSIDNIRMDIFRAYVGSNMNSLLCMFEFLGVLCRSVYGWKQKSAQSFFLCLWFIIFLINFYVWTSIILKHRINISFSLYFSIPIASLSYHIYHTFSLSLSLSRCQMDYGYTQIIFIFYMINVNN